MPTGNNRERTPDIPSTPTPDRFRSPMPEDFERNVVKGILSSPICSPLPLPLWERSTREARRVRGSLPGTSRGQSPHPARCARHPLPERERESSVPKSSALIRQSLLTKQAAAAAAAPNALILPTDLARPAFPS